MRISALTVVLVLAAAVPFAGCAKKPAQGGAGGPGGPGGGPPTVTVAHPTVERVVDWDDYIGRFEAINTAQVRARVSGFVNTVNFRDGQMVTKGQPLFTIDPRPYQATVDQNRGATAQARAILALARADFTRAQKLLSSQAISREDYDTRQATVAQDQAALAAAEANLRAAQLNLSFTHVTAPISGRASDRRVDPGNQVNGGQGAAGDLMTTIVSLDPIHFTFEGSEALYLKYQALNRAGQRPSSRNAANPVEIKLADEPTYRWKGHMVFVDNAIDVGSGAIRAKALVNNPGGYLTPGIFGHMRLIGSGAYDAIVVPDTAVVTDQARKLLYVVAKDGTVEGRPVELGPLFNGLRIVKSGVTQDDAVVIAEGQLAHPGAKVKIKQGKIVEPAPGASPDASGLPSLPAPSSATAAGGR